MLATLTTALLLGAPPAPEPATVDKDAPPAKLQLFGDESWYKNQKSEEKDFVGALSAVPAPAVAAAATKRFNPYRLTMKNDKGETTEREVYAGAHPDALAPYAGHKVRLFGKAVDAVIDGQAHAEIWPARVDLLDAAAAVPPPVPDTMDLLNHNKVYLADATPEKEYVGVLRKKKGEDAVGYILIMDGDKQDLHLYDEHYTLFDPYAGMTVKITGKKISGLVRNVAVAYILPGKLDVLPDGSNQGGKDFKVLARANEWPFMGAAAEQLAVRSPRELVLARGRPNDQSTDNTVQEHESTLSAKAFNVNTLDLTKQMVIVVSPGAEPTGGYNVEVTSLTVKDDTLTVHWRVIAPKPGEVVSQSVSHPVQAILTEYFAGQIVFDGPLPPAPPAPGK